MWLMTMPEALIWLHLNSATARRGNGSTFRQAAIALIAMMSVIVMEGVRKNV